MAENTIIIVWVCFLLAILIMALRLIGGRWAKLDFDIGDALTLAAIILSLARIAFTHVIVLWKTNNISDEVGARFPLSDEEVYHREMGSKFTLVARCLYISLLWIQKCVLLDFYRGLVRGLNWGPKSMIAYSVVFTVTYMTSIVVTFVECRPFKLYWKVAQDPDNCSRAIVQLFVVGGCNIATDIMLILLPIPILLEVRLNMKKKAQLAFIFSVGFLIVAVTSVRLPITLSNSTSETTRITWTTAEFVAATFVANVPTLYSIQRRLKKKNEPSGRFSLSGGHKLKDISRIHMRKQARDEALEVDQELEDTPSGTPPGFLVPRRGTDKDTMGTTMVGTSLRSLDSRISGLEIGAMNHRMSEEELTGKTRQRSNI